MLNYTNTVRDKVAENSIVMTQIANNLKAQALLGDFPATLDDAIMNSSEAHQEQMMQLLSDPTRTREFAKMVYNMLCA